MFWLPFPNNFYGMDMRDNYKGSRKLFICRARLVMSCFCHNSNLGRLLALQGQDLNSFQNLHLLLSASLWKEAYPVWTLVHQSLPGWIPLWAESNSICMTFRLISYLHLSRVCASSKWFLRNRSRAAMQSSRDSDRSDREHLGSRTSRAWLRQDKMLQKCQLTACLICFRFRSRLFFHSFSSQTLSYLSDLLFSYEPKRNLRSSERALTSSGCTARI